MTRRLWIMLICGILIVLIGNGLRLTFGIFLRPISADLDFGRQVFGLMTASQTLLFGIAQPVAGLLADRYGAAKVIVVGAALYALGLWMTSIAATAFDLYLSLAVLVGLGLSGTTQVIIVGAVGKVVPNERRGLIFGTVIAAGSLGMFIMVPGVQEILDNFGWRETFVLMALLMAIVPFLAIGVRVKPTGSGINFNQSVGDAIGEAKSHSGYLLLTAGFFVCGFHVSFIGTHFPAYLADHDVSPSTASYALGVIGLFNIIGAYAFGALGDKFRKKSVLTLIYLLRAVLMTVMLLTPINDTTALIFGASMGLLWLGTVPLTSSIVAQVFGTQHLSLLFGVVFMSHQFGGFSGAWLGGYIYDATGSYDLMWMVSVGLGVVANALTHIFFMTRISHSQKRPTSD